MPIPHRPKTTGHAIGSLCFVTGALLVDDAIFFIGLKHITSQESTGWWIAAALIGITVTIALLWCAYENWRGNL